MSDALSANTSAQRDAALSPDLSLPGISSIGIEPMLNALKSLEVFISAPAALSSAGNARSDLRIAMDGALAELRGNAPLLKDAETLLAPHLEKIFFQAARVSILAAHPALVEWIGNIVQLSQEHGAADLTRLAASAQVLRAFISNDRATGFEALAELKQYFPPGSACSDASARMLVASIVRAAAARAAVKDSQGVVAIGLEWKPVLEEETIAPHADAFRRVANIHCAKVPCELLFGEAPAESGARAPSVPALQSYKPEYWGGAWQSYAQKGTTPELVQAVRAEIPTESELWRMRQARSGIIVSVLTHHANPDAAALRASLVAKLAMPVQVEFIEVDPQIPRETVERIMFKGVRAGICAIRLQSDGQINVQAADPEVLNKVFRGPRQKQPSIDDIPLIAELNSRNAVFGLNAPVFDTETQQLLCDRVIRSVPPNLHLRSAVFNEACGAIVVRLGTSRVTELEMLQLSRALSSECGCLVSFRISIDSFSVHTEVRRAFAAAGFENVTLSQLADHSLAVTYDGKPEGFLGFYRLSREISESLPVDVRVHCPFLATLRFLRKVLPSSFEVVETRKSAELLSIDMYLANYRQVASELEQLEILVSEATGWNVNFLPGRTAQRKQVTIPRPDEPLSPWVQPKPSLPQSADRASARRRDWSPFANAEPSQSSYVAKIRKCMNLQGFEPSRRSTDGPVEVIGFGACREIGRSAFLFRFGNVRVLADCGAAPDSDRVPEIPHSLVRDIDFVLLSHAHTDHSAMIPWLYNQGCRATLLGTETTLILAKLLQEDMRNVLLRYRQVLPPFEAMDIRLALEHATPVRYLTRCQLADDLFVTFYPAGHIPGSSMIQFEYGNGRTMLYGADFLRKASRLLNPAQFPEHTDRLFLETTRGRQARNDVQDADRLSFEQIMRCVDRGGKVILPVFSVGRAQEVLLYLSQYEEFGGPSGVPIYTDGMLNAVNEVLLDSIARGVDAGLSANASQAGRTVFNEHAGFYSRVRDREFEVFQNRRPAIIVTTSGMCVGRASDYIFEMASNYKNLLMFTGFQAPGSLGRRIADGAYSVELFGKTVPIRMELGRLQFSGHSYQGELWDTVTELSPSHVHAIHGDPLVVAEFIDETARRFPGVNFDAPERGVMYPLE